MHRSPAAALPPHCNPAPSQSAASCSSGWDVGPSPGSAPGGKPGSWPRRWMTRWCASSSFGSSTHSAALHTDRAVRRHLAEYLAEAGDRVPWWLNLAIDLAPPGSAREAWLAVTARTAAAVMARKFIAGATPAEAIQTVVALRRRKLAFTADILGEAVISELEADAYQKTLHDALARPGGPYLDGAGNPPHRSRRVWPDPSRQSLAQALELDRPLRADSRREIDRGRRRRGCGRSFARARRQGAYIHVDMEQYDYRALSYDLFCRVLEEPEFRDWPDVGIVVQAYHADAEAELRMLRDWVDRRGTPITIRLVKGAYWDYEVATARRLGWPEPVYLQKWQSDACFERCARYLVENHESLRPAFASHNIRSVAHAIAAAEATELPRSSYELQTLFGMGDAIQQVLVDRGHRVRVYTPFGAILPGMAYLVRRLLENTSNESFLKATLAETAPVDVLLRDPEEVGSMLRLKRRSRSDTPPGACR